MLGSSTIVGLTLLFGGFSHALPDSNILPPGVDGTNGPRDLYEATKLTGNFELVAGERDEDVALKTPPVELQGIEGITVSILTKIFSYDPSSSC